MPTHFGQKVLYLFGACMCSNDETNLSQNCLFFGSLSFEYSSMLILINNYKSEI